MASGRLLLCPETATPQCKLNGGQDIFSELEDATHAQARGTIRCTVLIETFTSSVSMHEILAQPATSYYRPQLRPLGLHLQSISKLCALMPTESCQTVKW